MTRIAHIQGRTVAVPLPAPVAFAGREVGTRHYTLVRIRDEDGAEGIGFCYAGNFGGTYVSHGVRELLTPFLVGVQSTKVAGIWRDLNQRTLLHGRAGSVMRGLSAIDIALWDLNARRAGLRLCDYIGTCETETVAAYASGGYYQSGKTPEDLGAELKSYVDLGFVAVKMKVGRADPELDEQRVACARDAIGSNALLMLDANNAWTNVPRALEYLRRFEPYDPYWIEEPFPPEDIESHARLARTTPIVVATGEVEQGLLRHKALLDAGAAAVLQTDAAVCGGITEFLRIAATAASYGVEMAPHWFHPLHIHLVAAVPNATYVEFFPDRTVFNFADLIDTDTESTGGGRLALPTQPGLGFSFAIDAVESYAVDKWA